jgi:hypothetical protein
MLLCLPYFFECIKPLKSLNPPALEGFPRGSGHPLAVVFFKTTTCCGETVPFADPPTTGRDQLQHCNYPLSIILVFCDHLETLME